MENYGTTEEQENMVHRETEIENFAEVVKELKGIIYEKNQHIDDLNGLLTKKDKIISQYEKTIEIVEAKME